MRRIWVILAAIVMLAQWSYATAGGYCSHESEQAAAAHWGHHFHSHAVQNDAKESPDSKMGFDGDCPFCHAAHAFGPASFVDPSLTAQLPSLNAAIPPRLTSRSADLPERPQWRVPALA